MALCTLTICFEDPFWIGLIETEHDGRYQVARHVFGAEPTDPEVELFIHENWNALRFTAELQVIKQGGAKINPKRMRRIIEREVAANARRGTKAQQAIAEDREARKVASKVETREQKLEREAELRHKKRQKAKDKHRGH